MATRTTAASRSDKDAIAMLKADHQRVRQLVEQYSKMAEDESAEDDRKRRLAERICQEIEVHAQLEEELFYPAVRAAIDGEDLMDEAQVEHQSAKDLVRQIRGMAPDDALYDAKVKVLGEYVEHHVQEEEKEMFPKAKRAKVDVAGLARRMADRRRQLESEQSMEPFEMVASMLMMPIRAAASAARAGAAAGRRASGSSAGRATASAGSGRKAATGRKATGAARKAGAAAGRAAQATGRAAAATGRAAAAGGRAAAGTARKAAGTRGGATGRRAASEGGRATASGGRATGAASKRGAAGSGGGRASASAGAKGRGAKSGGSKSGAAASRRSRTTR
jgi:hemerythrin-like domain-containing protein